jgi:hypothetical protein
VVVAALIWLALMAPVIQEVLAVTDYLQALLALRLQEQVVVVVGQVVAALLALVAEVLVGLQEVPEPQTLVAVEAAGGMVMGVLVALV